MKIGVVGGGWGRAHCWAFREAGCSVEVIVTRDAERASEIARLEGVLLGTASLSALDSMDVVVIATPASTHLELIRRFNDKAVLCEKPLAGTSWVEGGLDGIARRHKAVNYAFSFLDTSRALRAWVESGRAGHISRVAVHVGARFAGQRTPVEWFMDIAVHPLSFLQTMFGCFSLNQFCVDERGVHLSMSQPGRSLEVRYRELLEEGIDVEVALEGERGWARMAGRYRSGRPWVFEPLWIDGAAQGCGEGGAEDVWARANARSVRGFVELVHGRVNKDQAAGSGLFDLDAAAQIERSLAPIFASLGVEGEGVEG